MLICILLSIMIEQFAGVLMAHRYIEDSVYSLLKDQLDLE